MTVSRRKFLGYGSAGAVGMAAGMRSGEAEGVGQSGYPAQHSGEVRRAGAGESAGVCGAGGGFDMREHLTPRRLTMAMWDVAYVLRHGQGGSFQDHDRVLDEAVERGYNTLRIDPMPQWVDLAHPERVLEWPDPKQPYMPWNWNTAVKGPVGQWVVEFVEKLHRRAGLHYTLSGWWFLPGSPTSPPVPEALRRPANMREGAEMWAVMLTEWKRRFGFERLVYVDIANETPYFFPDFEKRLKEATGAGWEVSAFTAAQIAYLKEEIGGALGLLRREFPEVRFTTSIHGDLRWLDVPVEMDCLDVHFYADADERWSKRTRFGEFSGDGLFEKDAWFAEFSERAGKTARAVAPMLRARQRHKMAAFAQWGVERGMPLTTSEAWATWYYIDHPKLDWGWLLEWAKWSVEDAVDMGFWGWTPHNYCQPQFANWKDVTWHRALTERFLKS